MTRVAKILLGIYLSTILVLYVVLAVILLPQPLGILKFVISLFLGPVVVAILFSPLFLVWSEENNLSGRWRLIFSITYTIVWLAVASVFIYQTLHRPQRLSQEIFTVNIENDNQLVFTNLSDDKFYSCRFLIISQGDRITYTHYFSQYRYANCERGLGIKDFLDCKLANQILESRRSDFITLDIFDSQSSQKYNLSDFYIFQTVSPDSFVSRYDYKDILSSIIECNSKLGVRVFQQLEVKHTTNSQ